MDFRPTETQMLVADTMASLVDDHLQRTRAGLEYAEACDSLWSDLAGMGLLAAEIDESYGGSGGSFEDLAIVLQGLGRAGGAGAFVPVVVMAAALIARFGDAAQKVSLSSDRERTAPGGSGGFRSVRQCRQRSRRCDSCAGQRQLVSERSHRHGPAGDAANAFIVSASTATGPTLFLLPADTEGLSIRGVRLYDGTGAAELRLGGCTLPDQARVGGEGAAGCRR